MKSSQKPQKLSKVKSHPILKRDQSIKQLHLQTLSKPRSLVIVHYRDKRLSIPIFQECTNGQGFLTSNLLRFEQEILKSKSLDHFRLLVGYRTKDRDALKDYYFTIGKDISIFKLLELEPIWRTPQQRKGLINFDFYRCLYNGKATKVHLVRHKLSGKFHALKLVRKDRITPQKAEMIKNEENVLKMVDSKYVVRMDDLFETQRHVVFVMEYCHGGSLKYHLDRHHLSEQEALVYILQTLKGLQKLHEMKIIHQSIQPSSLLLDCEGHIKLSGFGNSFHKLSKKIQAGNKGGEKGINQKDEQGYMLDFYNVGTLCYEMITGVTLKDKQHPVFQEDEEVSRELVNFVVELTNPNPNSRLGSLNGIKEVLNHPWLRNKKLQNSLLKHQPSPIQPNLFVYYSNQEYDVSQDLTQYQKEYQSVPQLISPPIDSDSQIMKPIKSPQKPSLKSQTLLLNKSRSKQNKVSLKTKDKDKDGKKIIKKTSNKKITINIEISKKKEIETSMNNMGKHRSQGRLNSKHKPQKG